MYDQFVCFSFAVSFVSNSYLLAHSGSDSFPVSSCWYFYCKFEEGRLERDEEVEAKGMMGRKGRREEGSHVFFLSATRT